MEDRFAENIFTGQELSAVQEARTDHALGVGWTEEWKLGIMCDRAWVDRYAEERKNLIERNIPEWDGE